MEGGGGGHDSPATQNDPEGSPATQSALWPKVDFSN